MMTGPRDRPGRPRPPGKGPKGALRHASTLLLAVIFASAIFTTLAIPNGALAKGSNSTTSIVLVSASTTICIGTFCVVAAPQTTTTTSTTTVTSVTTVDTTTTSTALAYTTTTVNSTTTTTQFTTSTGTATLTETTTQTFTTTSISPETVTEVTTTTEYLNTTSTSTQTSTLTSTTTLTTTNVVNSTSTVTVTTSTSTTTSTSSAGGGGGGGCVAYGTPILTPSGYVPVQNLHPGDAVMEYNFTSQSLFVGTLISANTTAVSQLIEVNNGTLYLTPTDQPIYIQNSTFTGWLHNPEQLTTADSIFDPVHNLWVHVFGVQLVQVNTFVYDVVTSGANNFVGNGVLLDVKVA